MGQGFFGYNPPQFVLDAAHEALGRVECNQYSPTKVLIPQSDTHIQTTPTNGTPSRAARV